jgi:hypothetical protein
MAALPVRDRAKKRDPTSCAACPAFSSSHKAIGGYKKGQVRHRRGLFPKGGLRPAVGPSIRPGLRAARRSEVVTLPLESHLEALREHFHPRG